MVPESTTTFGPIEQLSNKIQLSPNLVFFLIETKLPICIFFPYLKVESIETF